MGWAAFLKGAFAAATLIGRAVGGAFAPVIKTIVRVAKDFVDGVVSGFGDGIREKPKSAQEHSERELQQVNEEIARLRKTYQDQGGLNDQQKRRWTALKQRRDELNAEISGIDKFAAAEDIVKEEKNYQPVVIVDTNAHVLQYYVGQSAYNKFCSCGRAMILQWDRSIATPRLSDFFWGCSGYYIKVGSRSVCGRTQKLTEADLHLFANMNRPEFEMDSVTLTRETINPVKARRIRQALDSIRDAQQSKKLGIATYRCPIHGESLRLQRKNAATDSMLDEYFLGCPRWLPSNAGCNFLVKLKSAAQISSVLNTEQNTGVLSV